MKLKMEINEPYCKFCKRSKKKLEMDDIELRKLGNPYFPEYVCDDCLFAGCR